MITVFTATYNRVNTLPKLYNSLLNQTSKNFEWLIIDDGSSDNTKNLIDSYIIENKINIRYFYQKNGGKHRAINKGIDLAKGCLFFIVDSDDYLSNDSIEIILNDWNNIIDKNEISGITYRKFDFDKNTLLGNSFKEKEFISNHIEIGSKYGEFDKAEVFNINILKKYKFPEFKNEKFVPEGHLWAKITLDFNMKYIDKIIYYCEYLEDGYTKNFKKNFANNPKGFRISYNYVLKNNKYNLIKRIKSLIRIIQSYYYEYLKKVIR